MVKNKIACYITGGWTECGYMTQFLKKINGNFEYMQRFPRKNIGKKGKERKNFEVKGTTGTELIKKAYADMRKHKEILRNYSAILIEDDMDEHYFKQGTNERDYDEIEVRKAEITAEIRNILGKENMSVFFLYALPEIESWFVADWDNTFGKEYVLKLANMNSYFSITFRNYVVKNVLTDVYPVNNIENYGLFYGQYKKLSDELILAFQKYSYEDSGVKNNAVYNVKINELIKKNELRYSKKEEGINMLRRLSPDKTALVCGRYFAKTYHELKAFVS